MALFGANVEPLDSCYRIAKRCRAGIQSHDRNPTDPVPAQPVTAEKLMWGNRHLTVKRRMRSLSTEYFVPWLAKEKVCDAGAAGSQGRRERRQLQ